MSKGMGRGRDFLVKAGDKKGITVNDVLRIFPGAKVVSRENGKADEEVQLSLLGEVSKKTQSHPLRRLIRETEF